MAQFIELESPFYDEGYAHSMKKSGVIKSKKAMVNVAEISSIERYEGSLLHEGWDCSLIIMTNGTKYFDKSSPAELFKALSYY